DDGRTVLFDPPDTAPLLITGQTTSGKTGAAPALGQAAPFHGGQESVRDPGKTGTELCPVNGQPAGVAKRVGRWAGRARRERPRGGRRGSRRKGRGGAEPGGRGGRG
ncbi:UNVERIFIED_CONTAM: hypothetical protein DV099_10790, partial [Bifidobacterium longum]|nr:hypothetical protein [Bifidobacterium longum]